MKISKSNKLGIYVALLWLCFSIMPVILFGKEWLLFFGIVNGLWIVEYLFNMIFATDPNFFSYFATDNPYFIMIVISVFNSAILGVLAKLFYLLVSKFRRKVKNTEK